jgi:hypothetical protein
VATEEGDEIMDCKITELIAVLIDNSPVEFEKEILAGEPEFNKVSDKYSYVKEGKAARCKEPFRIKRESSDKLDSASPNCCTA